MARIARIVVPHYPHHITQRGNHRQTTFFSDYDYNAYLGLLTEYKNKFDVRILAYCLMPNHVHIVAVPNFEEGLAKCMARIHRDYARKINKRNRWQGHLWSQRFYSSVMDQNYLISTMRYVELNPVRAKLCESPEQWKWSSARAHLDDQSDGLIDVTLTKHLIPDWVTYLAERLFQKSLLEFANTPKPVDLLAMINSWKNWRK